MCPPPFGHVRRHHVVDGASDAPSHGQTDSGGEGRVAGDDGPVGLEKRRGLFDGVEQRSQIGLGSLQGPDTVQVFGHIDVRAQNPQDFLFPANGRDNAVVGASLPRGHDIFHVMLDDIARIGPGVGDLPVFENFPGNLRLVGHGRHEVAPQGHGRFALHDYPSVVVPGPEIEGKVAQHGLQERVLAAQGLGHFPLGRNVEEGDDDRGRRSGPAVEHGFRVDGQPALRPSFPPQTHDLIPQGRAAFQGGHGRMVADGPGPPVGAEGGPGAHPVGGRGKFVFDSIENFPGDPVPEADAPVGILDDHPYRRMFQEEGGRKLPVIPRTEGDAAAVAGLEFRNAPAQSGDLVLQFPYRLRLLNHEHPTPHRIGYRRFRHFYPAGPNFPTNLNARGCPFLLRP
ncbi:hypothetical protein DSECCO2_494870 [anaerobic digester metagenome]